MFELVTGLTGDAFGRIERFRDSGRLYARIEGVARSSPASTTAYRALGELRRSDMSMSAAASLAEIEAWSRSRP